MNQAIVTDAHIRSAIYDHITGFWPNSVPTEETWGAGPISENVPDFTVLKLKSRTPERPIIYISNGCFVTEPTQHIKHEFFLIAPKEDRRHVETVTMLANFHADKSFRLDVGSILNIGSPWIADSTCDHLLISVPYPYGPKLEWLKVPDICVRFLWALPITAREAGFAELNGYQALEEKFDATKPNYLDPFRPSVV